MKLRNALLAAGAVGVVLAVALASQTAVTQQKPLKLGVVDLGALVAKYDGTQASQKLINAEGDKWNNRIKALESEHQEMSGELLKQKPFLEDAEIRRRQREIEDKARDVGEARTDANEAILKMRNKLLDPILQTAEKAIQKYSEEHDYDMLFERGSLVYHKPVFNATDSILQMMNDELKAAGGANSGNGETTETEGAENSETTETEGAENSETTETEGAGNAEKTEGAENGETTAENAETSTEENQ